MLETVVYAIIFLLVLVTSNVLNKIFPRLPLPLVQVVMGLVLGLAGAGHILAFNSDIFLAFIVAPLLFREAEKADVRQIFHHVRLILVLIVPLVILTALSLGYVTSWLYAGLPLAATVALGGTLAPTDAVVTSSLSERYIFPDQVSGVLKGEGLLNDASGIIVFQVAVAALTIGNFSPVSAGLSLLYAAVGGAAVGFILSWLTNLVLTLLEDVAAQDTVGYLILELTVPLAAFLVADELDMSGIIAVVVAGIMQAAGLRRTSLFDAQVTHVKNTVWDTLGFVLNSTVFILLGIELYQLMRPLVHDTGYSNLWLLLAVLVLTLVLFAVRFIVLIAYFGLVQAWRGWRSKREMKAGAGDEAGTEGEVGAGTGAGTGASAESGRGLSAGVSAKAAAASPQAQPNKLRRPDFWQNVALLTFSGSKGTIGIAAVLLLPRSVLPSLDYALLIFLCAAVTGLSFLVSLFIVPLFAQRKVEEVDNSAKIAILTEVIGRLEEAMQQTDDKRDYVLAVEGYQERIQRLIIEQENATISTDYNDLKLLIMQMEIEGLEDALRRDEISMFAYRAYQRYLHSLETSVGRHLVSSFQYLMVVILRGLHFLVSRLLHIDLGRRARERFSIEEAFSQISELYFRNTEIILEALENLEGVYDEQLVDFLQAERLRTAGYLAEGLYGTAAGGGAGSVGEAGGSTGVGSASAAGVTGTGEADKEIGTTDALSEVGNASASDATGAPAPAAAITATATSTAPVEEVTATADELVTVDDEIGDELIDLTDEDLSLDVVGPEAAAPETTTAAESDDNSQPGLTEIMHGYYLERSVIFQYAQRGDISQEQARELQQNVNTLEDYAMAGQKPGLLSNFLNFRR